MKSDRLAGFLFSVGAWLPSGESRRHCALSKASEHHRVDPRHSLRSGWKAGVIGLIDHHFSSPVAFHVRIP